MTEFSVSIEADIKEGTLLVYTGTSLRIKWFLYLPHTGRMIKTLASSEECVFDIFERVLQISVHESDVSRIVTCVTVSWKHM